MVAQIFRDDVSASRHYCQSANKKCSASYIVDRCRRGRQSKITKSRCPRRPRSIEDDLHVVDYALAFLVIDHSPKMPEECLFHAVSGTACNGGADL